MLQKYLERINKEGVTKKKSKPKGNAVNEIDKEKKKKEASDN